MGPECAAQQAKWVIAIAHTGQARTRDAPPSGRGRAITTNLVGLPGAVGALLSSRAAGITRSQARSPRMSNAVRQSYWLMSQRESGERARIPKPFPADTMAAARPRRPTNHLTASTVSGT